MTLPLPSDTQQEQMEGGLQQGGTQTKGVAGNGGISPPGAVSPEQPSRFMAGPGLGGVAGAQSSPLQAATPSTSMMRALCLSPPPALLQVRSTTGCLLLTHLAFH
jgi:hypothetical protein